jgi:hypothetical protein
MKHLAIPIAAITFVASSLALAAPVTPPDPVYDRPSTPPDMKPGAYEHDGFYLRFGGGFAPYAEGVRSDDENAAAENSEGTVTGFGPVGELMIGGSLSRRLILGGGIWTATVISTDFNQENGDPVPEDLRDPNLFAIAGPFLDWYFGKLGHRVGQGGWHLQGAVGFASMAGYLPDLWDDDENRGYGAGFMVGLGYDWWVSEQWKLGVLGRATVAGIRKDDLNDDTWYHGVASFPAVLFTGTYN